MNTRDITHYSVGTKVWYRDMLRAVADARGVVEDSTIDGTNYYIRLESDDGVWAEACQLLPR
jgi:hypothetical protein